MLISAEGRIELTRTEHAAEVGFDVSSDDYFKEGKEDHFTDLFYNNFQQDTYVCCNPLY